MPIYDPIIGSQKCILSLKNYNMNLYKTKSILLLILISILCIELQSQSTDFTPLDLKAESSQVFEQPKVTFTSLVNMETSNKSSNSDLHLLDNRVYESWDEDLGEWVNSSKLTYLYNEDYLESEVVYYLWDDIDWIPNSYKLYDYDANSNLIAESTFDWDEDAQDWIPDLIYDFNYNPDGRIENWESVKYNANIDTFIQYTKKEYSYDGYGKLDETIQWFQDYGVWELTRKETWTYNVDDQLSKYKGFRWDDYYKYWIPTWENKYSYDSSGLLIEDEHQQYDYQLYLWTYEYKWEFLYDDEQNLAELIYYDGDVDYDNYGYPIEEWALYSKYTFDYDLSISPSELVLPTTQNYFFSLPGQSGIKISQFNRYRYDNDSMQWSQSNQAFFNYIIEMPVGSTEYVSDDLHVYPNPVQDKLIVDIPVQKDAWFELFDLQGRKLISKQVADGQSVLVGQLDPAVYHYRLTLADESYSGKLVKF